MKFNKADRETTDLYFGRIARCAGLNSSTNSARKDFHPLSGFVNSPAGSGWL